MKNPNNEGHFSLSCGSTYEFVRDSYFLNQKDGFVILLKTDDILNGEKEHTEKGFESIYGITQRSSRFLIEPIEEYSSYAPIGDKIKEKKCKKKQVNNWQLQVKFRQKKNLKMTRIEIQKALDKYPEDMELYVLSPSGWFMEVSKIRNDSIEGMDGDVEVILLISNCVI